MAETKAVRVRKKSSELRTRDIFGVKEAVPETKTNAKFQTSHVNLNLVPATSFRIDLNQKIYKEETIGNDFTQVMKFEERKLCLYIAVPIVLQGTDGQDGGEITSKEAFIIAYQWIDKNQTKLVRFDLINVEMLNKDNAISAVVA